MKIALVNMKTQSSRRVCLLSGVSFPFQGQLIHKPSIKSQFVFVGFRINCSCKQSSVLKNSLNTDFSDSELIRA